MPAALEPILDHSGAACYNSGEINAASTSFDVAAGVAAFGVLSRLAMIFIPRSQMSGIASNAQVAFGRSERSAFGCRGDEPDVRDASQLTSRFRPKEEPTHREAPCSLSWPS
jgi:hypothetical protein